MSNDPVLTVEPYRAWVDDEYFWKPAYTLGSLQVVKSIIDGLPLKTLNAHAWSSHTAGVPLTKNIHYHIIKALDEGTLPEVVDDELVWLNDVC